MLVCLLWLPFNFNRSSDGAGVEESSALNVEQLLGGDKRLEDLDRDSKAVKKFALRSLRGHLAEVMPAYLDDHILDNILEHINSQEEGKFVTSSAEEKSVVAEIYERFSEIYQMMTFYLHDLTKPSPTVYGNPDRFFDSIACSQWMKDLHEWVSRVSEETSTTEEAEDILEDSPWITNQMDEVELKAK